MQAARRSTSGGSARSRVRAPCAWRRRGWTTGRIASGWKFAESRHAGGPSTG